VWTKVDSLAQLELCCCEAGGRVLESSKWEEAQLIDRDMRIL